MKSLRQWRWGELPTYNGFVHVERVRGWQAIHFLIDNGWLQRRATCCISGQTEKLRLHSESYYEPEGYVLGHTIHMALHQRFNKPGAWRRIVAQYSVTGDEWFARLPLSHSDLAHDLRTKRSPKITDVFGNISIPSGVEIPRHQIYTIGGAYGH